jgi:hypothetical protein
VNNFRAQMTLALFVSSLPLALALHFCTHRAAQTCVACLIGKESFRAAWRGLSACARFLFPLLFFRVGNKGGGRAEATRRIPMRDLFFADNYLAGTLVRPPARTHKLCAWIYGFFMWPEMQVYVRQKKACRRTRREQTFGWVEFKKGGRVMKVQAGESEV